jgi:hypothetical protein
MRFLRSYVIRHNAKNSNPTLLDLAPLLRQLQNQQNYFLIKIIKKNLRAKKWAPKWLLGFLRRDSWVKPARRRVPTLYGKLMSGWTKFGKRLLSDGGFEKVRFEKSDSEMMQVHTLVWCGSEKVRFENFAKLILGAVLGAVPNLKVGFYFFALRGKQLFLWY